MGRKVAEAPIPAAEFIRESNCRSMADDSNTNYLYIPHGVCIQRKYQEALDFVAASSKSKKRKRTEEEIKLQEKCTRTAEFAAFLEPLASRVNNFQERLKPCSGTRRDV